MYNNCATGEMIQYYLDHSPWLDWTDWLKDVTIRSQCTTLAPKSHLISKEYLMEYFIGVHDERYYIDHKRMVMTPEEASMVRFMIQVPRLSSIFSMDKEAIAKFKHDYASPPSLNYNMIYDITMETDYISALYECTQKNNDLTLLEHKYGYFRPLMRTASAKVEKNETTNHLNLYIDFGDAWQYDSLYTSYLKKFKVIRERFKVRLFVSGIVSPEQYAMLCPYVDVVLIGSHDSVYKDLLYNTSSSAVDSGNLFYNNGAEVNFARLLYTCSQIRRSNADNNPKLGIIDNNICPGHYMLMQHINKCFALGARYIFTKRMFMQAEPLITSRTNDVFDAEINSLPTMHPYRLRKQSCVSYLTTEYITSFRRFMTMCNASKLATLHKMQDKIIDAPWKEAAQKEANAIVLSEAAMKRETDKAVASAKDTIQPKAPEPKKKEETKSNSVRDIDTSFYGKVEF